jgi:hypothetical protein
MTEKSTADAASTDLSYSYRPSLLGAGWTFQLMPSGIAWTAGIKSGFLRYGNVTLIRMSFRPISMQWHRFTTSVWSEDGQKIHVISTSWKSLVEQERLDDAYSMFVEELHRRVAAASSGFRCEKGINRFLYWPGVLALACVSLGLAFLVTRALQASAWGGAIFVGGFLLLFLWQAGAFFRRNKPGIYSPHALPAELMPDRG